jgi:hypothetical protein
MGQLTQTAQATWRVVGVSVQGTSHVRDAKPCQDANRWCVTAGGLLIAAVADGAGSAAHSEIGSACAVRVAVEEAADRLRDAVPCEDCDWQPFLQNVFAAARQAVEATATARQAPAAQLATTLLLAIVTEDSVVAGQIGDGAVIVQEAADRFVALTKPSFGEYLNETVFLTSADAIAKCQCQVHHGAIGGLILFSDGLQMQALRMPQGTPHAPFFAPLMQFMAAADEPAAAEDHLRKFLQSPRIAGRTDDDLTLVLAIRPSAVAPK